MGNIGAVSLTRPMAQATDDLNPTQAEQILTGIQELRQEVEQISQEIEQSNQSTNAFNKKFDNYQKATQ